MQHAARAHTGLQIRIGRVDGAGNETVLGSLSALPEIDEQDIPALEKPSGIANGDSPAASRKLVLRQSDRIFAGTATSIIFGLGKFRLFITLTYSSTDLTWRRGFQAFSSPIVLTVSPL
jgi:hypothetical protein